MEQGVGNMCSMEEVAGGGNKSKMEEVGTY